VGSGSGGSIRLSKKTDKERESAFDDAENEVRNAQVRNVFISFHIEDEDQVRLLRHQARDNQFGAHFRDYSVKEPFDEKWRSQCRERIEQTSALICMIGEDTWDRKAVEWEIREAHRQNKLIIGVRIHRDRIIAYLRH